MRLLPNRLIRGKSRRQVSQASEGRDAIVHSINLTTRKAIVRIQGLDEDVYATWSQNLEEVPPFLRVGNAVRLYHPKGNRHKWEITSNAKTIPTPISGSILPVQPGTNDTIISGLATLVAGGMNVTVNDGVFRINEIHYTPQGLLMGISALGDMGDLAAPPMGADFSALLTITAADATLYRVDMLCIGADGTLDYYTGTPHATDPVAPDVPASHVLVTTIIVPPGVTTIQQGWIGTAWTAPILTVMLVEWSNNPVEWLDPVQTTATVTLLSQYNIPFASVLAVKMYIMDGNGWIRSGSNYLQTLTKNTAAGVATFVYERHLMEPAYPPYDPVRANDISPTIKVEVITNTNIYQITYVQLYNSSGEFMYDET